MLTVEEVKDTKRFPSHVFGAKLAPKTQEQRKDPMCRVRITSLVDGQVIPGGHRIPAGVHEAVIHESDLSVVEAMVEKDLDLVDTARKAFNRKVEQSAQEEIARCQDRSPESLEVKAVLQKAHEQFPGSVAGTFRQFNDRDILPFASVEVLQRGLVAPAAQQLDDMQRMIIEGVSKSGGGTDVAAIVGTVMEQLAKAGWRGPNQNQNK